MDTEIDPNGDGFTGNVFLADARVPWSSFTGLIDVVPVFQPTGNCPVDVSEIEIVFYSVVHRFITGDLLYAQLDEGFGCGASTDATTTFELKASIIGGTGRFIDAGGEYELSGTLTPLLVDGFSIKQAAVVIKLDGTITSAR